MFGVLPQPWRCLCRALSQMTMTRPCRRITLHLSQIFFTDGWTFTGAAPHSFGSCAVDQGLSARPSGHGADRLLLVAVDDATAGQVVGRELHDHAVLGEDADVVLTHLAADVGEHPVSVLQLDPEHRVGQRLDDATLDLDGPVFLCHALHGLLVRRAAEPMPERHGRWCWIGDLAEGAHRPAATAGRRTARTPTATVLPGARLLQPAPSVTTAM